MTTLRKCVLGLIAAVACSATGWAETTYATLKASDADGTAAAGAGSFMSSFLCNPADAAYGWSNRGEGTDELDPAADYKIGTSRILRTPCSDALDLRTKTYVFPGKSLTLDGGTFAFRSSWNNAENYATVVVDDMIAVKGAFSNESWSRPTCWGGQITVAAQGVKDAVKFRVNMSTCHIPAKMVASAQESVLLEGPSLSYETSPGGAYRWTQHFEKYCFRFEGDCSDYFATNDCSWGVQGVVATSDFGGTFNLQNLGTMTVGDVSSAVVRGKILSRDGTIRVPASTSLDVRGGIDSAYATFESHVYAAKNAEATNVYTRLPADVPYANTNYVTGGTTSYSRPVNVIQLGKQAALATTDARLDGTLVQVPAGATLTIGDATFRDVILDIDESGRVAVTNSLVVETPVRLRLSGSGSVARMPLVTLPVDKGVLKVEDFVFENAPQFRFVPTVEVADGVQTLSVRDLNPSVKDATTGYVVLMTADGNSGVLDIGSYNEAGHWSEPDDPPHSGTNYFTNGKLIRDRSATSKTFAGDSLTQSASFRVGRTSFEIADWRVLSNGQKDYASRTGLTTAGSTGTFTFEGRLTVFADASSPFTLYGGLSATNKSGTVTATQTYVMKTKIVGAADAAIAAEGATTRAPGNVLGQVVCEFPGDLSEFYGTLFVGTNETIRLGNWGLTNGTLVTRTAYSTIATKADAGPVVPVRRYVAQTTSAFDVAGGTTLAITDGADLTGALTQSGAGTLAFGGAATAGAGARVVMAAGALETLSKTALAGVPVDLADGASGVVDWASEDGLFLGASDVTFGGAGFEIAFANAPDEFDGECVKKLLTVKDADAAAFAGKLSVARRKGMGVELLAPVSEGGLTTFSARVFKPGVLLIVR